MTNTFFVYLLQSSLCLILFMTTYRLLISKHSRFSWMRFFLVSSLTLSLVLPLVIIPIQWNSKSFRSETFSTALQSLTNQSETYVSSPSEAANTPSQFTPQMMVLYFILTVYLIGVVFKMYSFYKNLSLIFCLIKKNPKVKEGSYWLVNIKNEVPAFSFFNYIFINSNYKNLSAHELELMKNHEIEHIKQCHTLDLLFVEIASIVFWFNPLMGYLRTSIQEIHEYTVDEKIAGEGENKKVYASLLLNLASGTKAFNLATGFTGNHIQRRILMIATQRTSEKSRLMFIVLAPITAILLLSFSYIRNPDSKTQTEVTGPRIELEKYCGVYLPTKRDNNFALKPMEILLKDNKLIRYIESETDPANRTVELQPEQRQYTAGMPVDNVFSYTDNSARSIEFTLDNKKEVTGCVVIKFETRVHSNYLVFQGEYSKR